MKRISKTKDGLSGSETHRSLMQRCMMGFAALYPSYAMLLHLTLECAAVDLFRRTPAIIRAPGARRLPRCPDRMRRGGPRLGSGGACLRLAAGRTPRPHPARPRAWRRRWAASAPVRSTMGAHSGEGDQPFRLKVITDSGDRDHADHGRQSPA